MNTTDRVLAFLMKHPESDCSDVGTVIDNRRGRISASTGGGDYAAQMLLGRLRKAGLVEHARSEGATRWRLTPRGIKRAVDRRVCR